MDKKDSRVRPAKTSGRKVVKKEYDWDEFDRRTGNGRGGSTSDEDAQPDGEKNIHLLTEKEIRQRYQRMQKQKRLKMQRIRALIIFLSAVIVVLILLFMTPVFNIRSISVTGNQIVTIEEFDAELGSLVGENLFKTGSGTITKRLHNIAYIDSVAVSKRIFPPSVKVTVTEHKPAGYININGYEVVVNSELKVLDDKNNLSTDGLPEITGVNTDKYTLGKQFETDNPDKTEILKTCLNVMEKTGIINDINSLDVSNMTGIEFIYQNRINVLCGTQLDLERKLNLFRETILSNNIAENAKGTIDLTVTGKAVYTP